MICTILNVKKPKRSVGEPNAQGPGGGGDRQRNKGSGWCGSVGWSSSHALKGCLFDSQSGRGHAVGSD